MEMEHGGSPGSRRDGEGALREETHGGSRENSRSAFVVPVGFE